MKRMILALVLLATPVAADAGTLFPGYIEVGGYGAAIAEFSQLGDDDMGFFIGGEGGLVLNRQFLVGADLSILASITQLEAMDYRLAGYR